MNNEQKYKELVGKIKKAYLYAQTDSTKAVLEDILPELAESDDERIRKEIISALKWANHKGVYDKHIGWLEKSNGEMSMKIYIWFLHIVLAVISVVGALQGEYAGATYFLVMSVWIHQYLNDDEE